jgi:valyl-tRNA synthetase
MSKSKGNVVTPMPLLEQHGADAVRYWAANGRPGTDTAMDEGQMKVGRRLAIKLLNASKFALGVIGDEPTDAAVTEPLDRSMLAALAELVGDVTVAFEEYDYARALERTERFFWGFCDDYLELVKQRAYGSTGASGAGSARAALATALATLQRLFAPFLCYVTEEVWSWWQDGSVHRQAWPSAHDAAASAGDAGALDYLVAAEVLGAVRKVKSEARRSMRAEVTHVLVTDAPDRLDALGRVEADVRGAGSIAALDTTAGDALAVVVELADEPAA